MVAIDARELRKRAPSDRIDQIRVLRKVVADELKTLEQEAMKHQAQLDELEREARREMDTMDRVRVPQAREVEVERLFKREKKLEEQVEDAPRAPAQRMEYAPREAINAVYAFSKQQGYEHIASIRDKVAAGEQLNPHEQQTLRKYDQLVHEFERVASSIHDEKARDLMSRTEKVINQIESYKTRKLDEREERKRQEF